MNAQDYKLIPLDDIAGNPALKASYLAMMGHIHREFWHDKKNERYVFGDVMYEYADLEEMENGFRSYLDYIHYRGSAVRRSSSVAVHIMALVNVKTGAVAGEAGFFLNNKDGKLACEGYDVISPAARGRGLGNIIIALRLAMAQELGAEEMHFSVKPQNWLSHRRMEKLEGAGLIDRSWRPDNSDMVHHAVSLVPRRAEQIYMNIMTAPPTGYELPAPQPLMP